MPSKAGMSAELNSINGLCVGQLLERLRPGFESSTSPVGTQARPASIQQDLPRLVGAPRRVPFQPCSSEWGFFFGE